MNFMERLESLRQHVASRHVRLPQPYPSVVLFLAVSDGAARADVVHASGTSFDAAWEMLVLRAHETMRKRRLVGKWLRIDWITGANATNWSALNAGLAKIKRNYFRKGLALDPAFEIAFLEQELNGNAMLYGGNAIEHAVVNPKNILTYAWRRYGKATKIDFSPESPVHVFSTQGVFSDDDGRLRSLDSSDLNHGRRRIERLSDSDVFALVESASNYLAHQVQSDGRFIYGYHPCFDRQIGTYNTLRHASTTYAMIEAWQVTSDAHLKDAIELALAQLTQTLVRTATLPDGTDAAFLVDVGDEVKLGGNAVTILALSKYCEVTGTDRYVPLLEKLALGIRFMQNPTSGAFVHVLNFSDLSKKEDFRTIYYEGEAAFALMRLYSLTRDMRWLDTVERAFEHFIEQEHWRHHDHWLSYCVNELTRYRPEERYFRFGLRNVADYLDFVRERITTFPTLLELMMAARQMLSRLDGMPELRHLLDLIDLDKFEGALEYRAHHLLNGHFWPETAMFFRNPARILGSFFIRHHAFRVRIDDVEHYLSGFVAYRNYLKERAAFRELARRQGRRYAAAEAGPASFTKTAPRPRDRLQPAWTAGSVEEATGGGRWLSPPPAGWSASGLCTYAPAMKPGNLVAVRPSGGDKGVPPSFLGPLEEPSGFIVSDMEAALPAGVPVLRVENVGEAILAMGRYARNRMSGRVLAVTGSAGKTTAVAMLTDALSIWGPTGQSAHSANLPHGVAWNLASIGWDTAHVVLEVAIGQMAISARMARPEVAVFTNILPAHLGPDSTILDVARTKARLFLGMKPGATAVLNRDMLEWETVHQAARAAKLDILHYGTGADCEFRLIDYDASLQRVSARIRGRDVAYRIGAAGRHMAMNSLATLAAISALGYDWEQALERLGAFCALPGRGEKLHLKLGDRRLTVIDDAYNANPGSMKAALDRLSQEKAAPRRVAVLGQMAELGPGAAGYHDDLAGLVEKSRIDIVHVTGELYAGFWERLPPARRGRYASSLDELKLILRDELSDGDTVLFKGSNSTRIHQVVAWLKENAASISREGPGSAASKAGVRPGAATEQGEGRSLPAMAPGVSILLYDCNRDEVVFSTGEDVAHPPASLTKLLTLCLVDERLRELGDPDGEKAIIPDGAENIDSWWGFPAGEAVEIETLMRAGAIVSSNEATHALAEWHSGSVARFTERLNAKTHELGLRRTRFSSPSGLGRNQQITTTDALKLALFVLDRHPRVAAFCAERSFTWRGKTRPSTNRLLDDFPGADGLKTGTLRGRGNHIIFSARQGGQRWLAVVLGAPTKPERDAIVSRTMARYAAGRAPREKAPA